MTKVIEVKTKKEQKAFVNFPIKLYKGNPNFVPPLYSDEMKIFKTNYVYHEQAEDVFFLAYDENNNVVGRISGIIQKASNDKNNEKRVRFTRFDSINDLEVAKALFNAVETWAKEKGMDTVCGPLGYSDLEREGLLIEGFDELSTFEEQYNYSYYQKLIEDCGYQKDIDWVEYKLYKKYEYDDRLKRFGKIMLDRLNLHIGTAKNTKDFLKKYSKQIFEVLDETYKELYGTVPFTDGMKKMMMDNFGLVINLNYVMVILDQDDNVVSFGFCIPSIAKAIKPSNGHLTPLAIIRLLKAIKKPKVIDLALIGTLPKYQNMGVSALILSELQDYLFYKGVEYAETNLNLEDNNKIQNQWKNFKAINHKRRRSFIKELK